MKKFKIDTVVIGVSGGIDSAVTLGLLRFAKKKGVIKNICAVCIPALDSKGAVSNQSEATRKGELVIKHFGEKPIVVDLSQVFLAAMESVKSVGIQGSPWSNGQLVPNLRTSIEYYLTSLYSDNKHRAIVIGTINRDEGSYLGYMGKAGDALVDIQLISDLHKSEVYKLAEFLKVPEEIVKAKPTGDMHDGRTDEEVFGTSYDFVELYLNYLKAENKKNFFKSFAEPAARFSLLMEKVEKLHSHNFHKYISSSAAVHLDLIDTYIKGGLKNNSTYRKETPLNPNCLVNFQKINEKELDLFDKSSEKVLNDKEIDIILNQIKTWEPVGIDGYLKDEVKKVGSYRATIYSQKLAEILKDRIHAQELTFNNRSLYRYAGVSPSFRLIKYENGGELVPHYDFPYEYSDEKKTLFSVVICLKQSKKGGETRFIKEKRENHGYSDWINAEEIEIEEIYKIEKGEALVFRHNRLHDSKKIEDGEKIIIRTDLVYEKV